MKITIGTSEPNSTFYSQASAIGRIAKERGVFDKVEVHPTDTASVGNADPVTFAPSDYIILILFVCGIWAGEP